MEQDGDKHVFLSFLSNEKTLFPWWKKILYGAVITTVCLILSEVEILQQRVDVESLREEPKLATKQPLT